MINAVLVFNNSGQPRLTTFYTQLVRPSSPRRSKLTYPGNIRPTTPHLRNLHPRFSPPHRVLQLPPPPAAPRLLLHLNHIQLLLPASESPDVPSLVTYRHYAALYFIISTSTESPLALIDLIQVYVEALDRLFENVCELDLIFNFETLHACLSEMIVGGVVVETGLERVVEGVKAQGKVPRRPVNESRGGGLGGGFGVAGASFAWAGR